MKILLQLDIPTADRKGIAYANAVHIEVTPEQLQLRDSSEPNKIDLVVTLAGLNDVRMATFNDLKIVKTDIAKKKPGPKPKVTSA